MRARLGAAFHAPPGAAFHAPPELPRNVCPPPVAGRLGSRLKQVPDCPPPSLLSARGGESLAWPGGGSGGSS